MRTTFLTLAVAAISMMAGVAKADTASVDQATMLYKFPVQTHASTIFYPTGEHAYPMNIQTWGVDATAISVDDNSGCCSHVVRSFTFSTGNISNYALHGGNGDTTSPAAGGDAAAYSSELDALREMLITANAAHDVIAYVDSIRYLVHNGSADLFAKLAADKARIIPEFSTDQANYTTLVAYNATTDRDILVDLIDDVGHGKWLGSGRVHVKAGSGTVRVPVTLNPAVQPGEWSTGIAIYAKILRTGDDYTKALGEDSIDRG